MVITVMFWTSLQHLPYTLLKGESLKVYRDKGAGWAPNIEKTGISSAATPKGKRPSKNAKLSTIKLARRFRTSNPRIKSSGHKDGLLSAGSTSAAAAKGWRFRPRIQPRVKCRIKVMISREGFQTRAGLTSKACQSTRKVTRPSKIAQVDSVSGFGASSHSRKPRQFQKMRRRQKIQQLGLNSSVQKPSSYQQLFLLQKMSSALASVIQGPLEEPVEPVEEVVVQVPTTPRVHRSVLVPEMLELPQNELKSVIPVVFKAFHQRHGKAHREGFIKKKLLRTTLSLHHLDDI